MDLELDEDQERLSDGLRALLASHCPVAEIRRRSIEGPGPDRETWRLLGEHGWTGIAVSERHGGAGLGFEEAMLASMECGRALLDQPLSETLVAGRALERHARAASQLEILAEVARGETRLTLALCGSPEAPPDGVHPVRGELVSGRWLLRGRARAVPHGPAADVLLLDVEEAGEGRLLMGLRTNHPGLQWSECASLDRSVRRHDLRLEAVAAQPDAVVARFSRGAPELERLLDEWRVLLAAESEGACRRMLELTATYAGERVQFGRPVGANQAVKVRIAEMAAAIERMRVAVYHAALKLERDASDAPLAAALAKSAAGAPASFVGSQAIHVHGALGFMWEQDLHLFVKRVKTNELLLGGERESLARIAQAVLD